MDDFFLDLWKEKVAVTSIEYALLAALIATIVAAAVTLTGISTVSLWESVLNCIKYINKNSSNCP